jgi:hypothetical protein
MGFCLAQGWGEGLAMLALCGFFLLAAAVLLLLLYVTLLQ